MFKPTEQPNLRKIKTFYISVGLLTVGLAVSNIFLSGRTISASTQLKLQEQQYAQLLSQKEELTAQLTQTRSIQDIEKYALDAGYVHITKTIAVKAGQDTSVASR